MGEYVSYKHLDVYKRQSLLIGRTGNAVTEITVDAEGKSGTIRTIRQAGTARHIRITYVLTGIFCKTLSHITAGGTFDD